jgi:hypothetical protein
MVPRNVNTNRFGCPWKIEGRFERLDDGRAGADPRGLGKYRRAERDHVSGQRARLFEERRESGVYGLSVRTSTDAASYSGGDPAPDGSALHVPGLRDEVVHTGAPVERAGSDGLRPVRRAALKVLQRT